MSCCCCSVTQLCFPLSNPMNGGTPGFPVLHYLPEFAETHVHQIDDAIQLSHPLSSPALNLSHQCLSNGISSLHQLAKVLELQLQHQSLSEYSGMISFRIDWFYMLIVQRTLKSLFHHHSSRASIYLCSAFFMVQLSCLYMTTGKIIAIWTLVGKVMFLLFNMFLGLS